MYIPPIPDNAETIKLVGEGFTILSKLAKSITPVTKEEDEKDERLSHIVVIYFNSFNLLGCAFDDLLESKYSSCVLNLRASFESHLVMEKLAFSTKEELDVWKKHIDSDNESTRKSYWRIFRPNKLIDEIKDEKLQTQYRTVYSRLSSRAHIQIRALLNVLKENAREPNMPSLSLVPIYRKSKTEIMLKDLMAIMWLNGSTVSNVFSQKISEDLNKDAGEWGNKLDKIGVFSKDTQISAT